MTGGSPTLLRRDQALAFIIEQLARFGASPTSLEIARELDVSETRAKQLVSQLIARGLVERIPGAVRGLRVRDVSRSRALLDEVLRRIGWVAADPMGELQAAPFPDSQLPLLPPFEHLPDLA